MKKLTTFLLSGILLSSAVFGISACADTEQTSADAPATTEASPEAPEPDEAKATQEDAQSEVRRDQVNSDIRAKEQRNNAFNDGAATGRSGDALAGEVRSKLEANIPAGQLTVKGEEGGVVTVAGTVPTQEQFDKIEPLAKEIKGVEKVNVTATVAPAQPETNN